MKMFQTIGMAVAACALSTMACGQELAVLPLGAPDRAFSLAAGEPGDLLDTRSGAVVEFGQMVSDLAKADVVILAEHHASTAVQGMEARLFAALAEQGATGLGMEFFDVEDDAALAAFVAGRSDVSGMLSQTGWYKDGGYSFKYYEPLLLVARERKAPVFGLNIPPAWLKTISQSGFGSLTAEQQERIGKPAEGSDRHNYMIAQMMGSSGEALASSLEVQRAWDGAMAESIKRHHAQSPDRTIVAVMGVGHAAHGLGVPARLSRIAPDLVVRVVAPVVAEEPDPDAHVHPGYEPTTQAVFSRGFADYVYVLADDGGREAYARLGVQLEVNSSGQIVVTKVRPNSIADRGGLREGDQLQMLGPEAAVSVDAVRRHFGALEFNQLLHLVIRRGVVSMPLSIIVVPTTDGPADWLRSEINSSILDSFDPLSSRAYTTGSEPRPTGTYARMVSFGEKPVRIDLFERGRLIESWVLDEHGRPILGLYADPTADGTMRLELDRNDKGEVTAERRLDERGQPVQNRYGS